MLAHAISAIEDHPHVPKLLRDGTPFSTVQCLADFSPSFPEELRKLTRQAGTDDTALEKLRVALLKYSPKIKAMLSTTQAVDLVEGGVKVNALPERASAVVNNRIAEHRQATGIHSFLSISHYPIVLQLNCNSTSSTFSPL